MKICRTTFRSSLLGFALLTGATGVSSSAWAKGLDLRSPLLHNWDAPETTHSDGHELQIVTRFLSKERLPSSIAHIIRSRTPKSPERSLDPKGVAALLAQAAGIQFRSARKIGNTVAFDGVLPETGRGVSLFVRDEGTHAYQSLAFFRITYGLRLHLEVEAVQRILAGETAAIPRSYAFLPAPAHSSESPWLRSAHAQGDWWSQFFGGGSGNGIGGGAGGIGGGGFPGGFSADDLNNLAGTMGQLSVQLQDLQIEMNKGNENWGTSNQNWNQSNQHWNQSNQNWQNTNQQAAEANANWAKTNEELAMTREMIDRQLTDYRGTIGEFQEMLGSNLDRFNTTLEKMTDPKHILLMGAAASAGAVLGSAAAHAAINGSVKALGLLYQWLSGDMKKRRMEDALAAFNEAMKEMRKADNIIRQTEDSIDSILSLHETTRKLGFRDHEKLVVEALAQVERSRREQKRIRTAIEAGHCENPAEADREIARLELQIAQFEKLRQQLSDHSLKNFCQNLSNSFLDIARAENLMQKTSLAILRNEPAFLYFKEKELKGLEKQAGKIRKGRNDSQVKRMTRRIEKSATQLSAEQIERQRESVLDDCVRVLRADLTLKRTPKARVRGLCVALQKRMDASGGKAFTEELKDLIPTPLDERALQKAQSLRIGDRMAKVALVPERDESAISALHEAQKTNQEQARGVNPAIGVDVERYVREVTEMKEFLRELKERTAFPSDLGARLDPKKKRAQELCREAGF